MKQPGSAIFQGLGRTGLLLLLSCGTGFAAGEAGQSDSASGLVTNVFQLCSLTTPWQGKISRFELEGTVLAADNGSGTFFLQDQSGAAVLEANLNGVNLQAGQRIRLSGTSYVVGTDFGLSLGTIPVVDNNGLHPALEKQNLVFLKAGEHPIQVNYFNRAATAELKVACSGPDLARQDIPDQMLWQTETAIENGASHRLPGLKYRCFEGQWNSLPNFDELAPAKTGTISNFDIGIRTRQEYVGLEFKGFFDVPRDGDYAFYLDSDDGSQLFLDSLPPKITVLGTVPLPAPAPVVAGQPLPAGQNSIWAEIEGTVTFLNRNDQGVELEVASDGNRMHVKLLNTASDIPPYLLHCLVRIQGICPAVSNVHGQSGTGLIIANGWRGVSVLNVPLENWKDMRNNTIRGLGNGVAAGESNGIVQLQGKICAGPETKSLQFEDGTGSAPIELLNGNTGKAGITVDCLSRWTWNGTNLLLQQAICTKSPGSNDAGSNDAPVLTTALQVQQLKPDEAGRKYPVELQGVITWTMLNNDTHSVVIQDATRAVYALLDMPQDSTDLRVGDFCKVRGFTLPGEFSPIVQLQKMAVLGWGQMPRPVTPTRDQLLNGSLDAQYVELRGMVIAAHDSYVTLLTSEGSFDINIAPGLDEPWSKLIDAIIQVRGVLFADWDKQTHRVILDHPILRIWAATTSLEAGAPADLFYAEKVSAKELMSFDAKFDPFQWVKISGQIIHGGPDFYYMMDGATGLRFRLVQSQHFDPGDEVNAVGLVELGGASPLLRQAVARKTGHAPLPEPQHLSLDSPDGQLDSTLVWLEGTLVDVKDRGTEQVLEMQVGVKSFIARLTSKQQPPRPWEIGSRLKLTGVLHVLDQNRTAEGGVNSFELLLDSPADVQILARPAWWTLERLLTMAALLLVGLALAGVWIALLHRQVERRTKQLSHEIGQREQAEKMRALEQERSRIARDLHDDLGSELTEISMLASPGPGRRIEPQNAVERLQDIAAKSRSMISALDGVVWVVNAKNDMLSSLIEYLASNAEEFLAKAGVGCRVEMPLKSSDRKIAAETRHDVLLAVREAFNNAVRHGHPGKVLLRFVISENLLEVLIKDDGCGFQLDKVAQGNGLVNIRERMRKIGGQCEIQSSPGEGTSVTLRLPI